MPSIDSDVDHISSQGSQESYESQDADAIRKSVSLHSSELLETEEEEENNEVAKDVHWSEDLSDSEMQEKLNS